MLNHSLAVVKTLFHGANTYWRSFYSVKMPCLILLHSNIMQNKQILKQSSLGKISSQTDRQKCKGESCVLIQKAGKGGNYIMPLPTDS